MPVEVKALADLTSEQTDTQSGDLMFIERAGAPAKITFANLLSSVSLYAVNSNIGVGIASPNQKLHVRGNLNLDWGSQESNPTLFFNHDNLSLNHQFITVNRVTGQMDFYTGNSIRATLSASGLTLPYGAEAVDGFVNDPTMAGNRTNKAPVEAAVKAYTDSYVKPFDSGEQAITSGGLLTLPHGRGNRPSRVYVELVCKTAEDGWGVGDTTEAHLNSTSDSSGGGDSSYNTVYYDDTNVYLRFSSQAACFITGHKSSGSPVSLTNSNWRVVVRAWK